MKYIVLLIVLIGCLSANAQIEATTMDGKEVLLYNNGSWEYVVMDTSTVKTSINSELNVESEMEELYYTVSPRLSRYFGEQKGKIRGRARCKVVNGQVQIAFQWEVILADAYRYFGYIKPGKKITLKTKNNDEIIMLLTEDVDYKVVSKYNYSIFKGTCLVSPEQLDRLLRFPVTEMKVDWKKAPESYQLNNPNFFKDTFSTLLVEK